MFLEDLKATFFPELAGMSAASISGRWTRARLGSPRATSGVPLRGARRVISLILESVLAASEGVATPSDS
jgi:hypothetical protein